MEGRLKQVEKNLTDIRKDVKKLEGWLQEMTVTLARIEAQGRTMMEEACNSQTKSVRNQEEGSNVNWAGEKEGKEVLEATLTTFRRRGFFGMDF